MQQISPIKAIYNLAQRNKIFVEYRLEKEFGPVHRKIYTVRLHVDDKSYVGTEHSIKSAKYAAAQLALNDYHNAININNYDQDNSQINEFQSPTVTLNIWSIQNHISIRYVLLNQQFKSNSTNQSCILFYYRLYLGHNSYFDGHGYTHQQARTKCALDALFFLRQNQISTQHLNVPFLSNARKQHPRKSDISLMYERAKQLGHTVHITFDDPLTVTYVIGENYSATATGSTQQTAKQLAARKMLEILPSTNIQLKLNPITRIYQSAQLRQVKIEFIQLTDKENFTYQIRFGDNDVAEGYGKTKKIAKQLAAEALLQKLDTAVVLLPPPSKSLLKRDGNNEKTDKQEKKHVHFVEEIIEKDNKMSSSPSSLPSNVENSYKQQLIETCQKLRIHIEYLDKMNENENGISAQYQSMVILSTADRRLAQFRGNGPSLIRAQENASSAVWNNLKQLFNGSSRIQKMKRIEKKYQ
ncbi:unnamed protein product [Rotaria socialis]|uniref:DRBM domain-containing protein n=2 Tax=Rotaria socialis TaxID=392032 RepID=A0A821JYT3_9BILA|nr:unnamed protein product [Rotaria socialis]CAF3228844.1 unnamed protein product [Rotaria socialis]CAF3367510.1 unnamed protein product [Rotaria socialis]CAF3562168.1 unnamed protein product [Rotaria socialis]CAF3716091.1 unnamed protein product [Rotaria socialis]